MDNSLDKYLKNNRFQVPEGYFEKLPGEVMKRISAEENKRLIVRRRWIGAISAAASLVLILGIGLFVRQSLQKNDNEQLIVVTQEKTVPTASGQNVDAAAEIPAPEDKKSIDLSQTLAYAQPQASKPKVRTQRSTAVEEDADWLIEDANAPIGDFEESDLDGIDYDILDFYAEDCSSLDFWDE